MVRLYFGGSGRDQFEIISRDMGVFMGRKRVGWTGLPIAG